jgi:hypothetical protein
MRHNAFDVADPELRIEWVGRIQHPVPDELALILGDILTNTNLRAALDHAVWNHADKYA